MAEYIFNLRRSPRTPARCAVRVLVDGSGWPSETEDLGPTGCQLVAPRSIARGRQLQLVLSYPGFREPLQVTGKVAWVTPDAPWRIGVAFAEGGKALASAWFARLVEFNPRLGTFRRVPDRLPVDAMLFLGPPPSLLVDFTPEEVEVVRHVATGATVDSLRSQLEPVWPAAQRAIFSLLTRGLLTVSRSTSAHPTAWKKVMAELGVQFVPQPAPASRPPRHSVPEVEWSLAPILEGGEFALDPAPDALDLPPLEAAAPEPGREPEPAARPGGPASAGTGWRGGGRTRSREAQEAFDLGQADLAAGRTSSALVHLRRAMQLAQGDAEIAAELGRAMSVAR